MIVVADENIPQQLIEKLRSNGFEVLSIRDTYRGIHDGKVIEIVKSLQGVLLTEDKDFGEWVFVHGIKGLSIILLRYGKNEFDEILDSVLKVLLRWETPPRPLFVTITRKKIRRRQI